MHERQTTTSNSGAFFSSRFGGHVKKIKKKKEENLKKKKKGPAVAGQLWLSGEVTGPLRATLVDTCTPKTIWFKACAPEMHHSFAVISVLLAFPLALVGEESKLGGVRGRGALCHCRGRDHGGGAAGRSPCPMVLGRGQRMLWSHVQV